MRKPKQEADSGYLLDLEEDTFSRVNKTISLIEIALSSWDASQKKPENLKKRIDYLRFSHSSLASWAKKSLTGRKDAASVSSRLMDFVGRCKVLEESKVR
jgi:hypothetical protein